MSIGVADKSTQFVALVARVKSQKRFSTNDNNDRTDYFTPCICMWGKNLVTERFSRGNTVQVCCTLSFRQPQTIYHSLGVWERVWLS